MAETILPSDTQPDELPPGVSSHSILNGNPSIRYVTPGGVTHTSDTPLPLRAAADAANLSNWDQPQPQQPQRSPTVVMDGPPASPFQSVDVRIPGVASNAEAGAVGADAAIGQAAGVGVAHGVGASIAEGVGSTAHRIDVSEGAYKISGEAPDIAQFVGHVTSPRTVIIRTVLNNQVAVQLTALSLLAALDLKIEALRVGGSNSEITEFDDLKHRVEEFLAANTNREEARIADTTLSIADGLRRYWTEKYENICDTALLGVGLSFCATAGAFGVSDTNILAVTAVVGGNRVVDVMKAAADLVWGRGDKS